MNISRSTCSTERNNTIPWHMRHDRNHKGQHFTKLDLFTHNTVIKIKNCGSFLPMIEAVVILN